MNLIIFPPTSRISAAIERADGTLKRKDSATIIILPVVRIEHLEPESKLDKSRRSLRLVTQRAALEYIANRANLPVIRAMIDDDLFHNGEPVPT